MLPLIAAIGIGALLLTMVAAIVPAFLADPSDLNQLQVDTGVEVTPGSEEAEMRERLEEDPNDIDAMIILADLLVNTGRAREAIPLFEKAVDLRPDDASLRVAFGRSLWRQGFLLDAELQLLRAREIAPDDPESLFLLGQVYESWESPRDSDAREVYERVLEESPESVYADRAQERLDQLGERP